MPIKMKPLHFEAIKVSHNKEKRYFTMAVHPDDMDKAEDFFNSTVGGRYVVAVAPLDDDERPVMEKTEGQKAYETFSSMCRNERFQRWMYDGGFSDAPNEEGVVAGLKRYIGIKSRKELINSADAREKFNGLRRVFWESVKRNAL